MLFDLVEILQNRRRVILVALFIILDLWLLLFGTQALQAHRSDITARIHTSESPRALSEYQSDMLTIDTISGGISHAANNVEVGVLRAAIATADGVTKGEQGVARAGKVTVHALATAATATGHATTRTLAFTGHVIAFPFVAVGHGVGHTFGAISGLNSRLVSVIKPNKNVAVPVITPEQAQQAFLIQDGTLDVKPIKPTGSGGACDNGNGNGGYPMDWCNAPMDALQTVSYSSDHINRECTSYAYWYFTTVEGHSDFHVTGNANRWAATANFPAHATPTVGAIAVETAGAYGHVAIVQALPGQTYDDKTVPAGYVLVSEMNYDWHGHFRYSYSPLNKFSAYIYP